MAAVAAEDLKRQERRPRVDPEPTSRHQTDQSLFGSSPFTGAYRDRTGDLRLAKPRPPFVFIPARRNFPGREGISPITMWESRHVAGPSVALVPDVRGMRLLSLM